MKVISILLSTARYRQAVGNRILFVLFVVCLFWHLMFTSADNYVANSVVLDKSFVDKLRIGFLVDVFVKHAVTVQRLQ